MSFLSKFLPANRNTALQTHPSSVPNEHPEAVDIDLLQTLIPIRNRSEEELNAFAARSKPERFPDRAALFKNGDRENSVLYLLKGKVRLEAGNGDRRMVDAESAQARFPLSNGHRQIATAYAEGDVSVLRVSNRVMFSEEQPDQADSLFKALEQADIPEKIRNLGIFDAYIQYLSQDNITLPILPDVAAKLRKAIALDLSVDRLVDIVQIDATIAAKLIQVANCPLFVATQPVSNCRDAIVRLGLKATRNLVLGISIKQSMQCKNQEIRQRMQILWQQSTQLAGLCFVFAAKTKCASPEEAMLAGLVADIGMLPFLQFVDDLPRNLYEDEEVNRIAPYITGLVGTHLLRKWDFPDELVAIPAVSENWYYDEGDTLQLADIVILSRLHLYIGTPKINELPPFNAIPACGKVEEGALSPEHSLKILQQAKNRIRDMLGILGT